MSGCMHMHLSREVHREYADATREAQRLLHKGQDHPDLRAAVARVEAAAAQMKNCVRDTPHPPPHRDADGIEWGWPEPEDEAPDEDMAYVGEAVALLDAIDGTTDPEAAHGEADRILLAAVHVDVSLAYKRLVERAKWWAGA